MGFAASWLCASPSGLLKLGLLDLAVAAALPLLAAAKGVHNVGNIARNWHLLDQNDGYFLMPFVIVYTGKNTFNTST